MTYISTSSLPSSLAGAEDITAVWDQCHPHLRPLDSALPAREGVGPIKIAAHIRVGGNSWFELTSITYDHASRRFFLTEEDRLAALGGRAHLCDLAAQNSVPQSVNSL